MRNFARALVMAAAALSPLAAEAAGANPAETASVVSGLEPTQVRRLEHYANKVLEEIQALAEAERARDREAEDLHADQIQVMAERFMGAAFQAGLDAQQADAYFQSVLAANYSGKLPRNLVSDEGLPSIQSLLAGTHRTAEETDSDPADLVDYLREEGRNTFSN